MTTGPTEQAPELAKKELISQEKAQPDFSDSNLSERVGGVLHPNGLSTQGFFAAVEMSLRNMNSITAICGVDNPTLSDFYQHFHKAGSDRTLDLDNKKGIGPKTKPSILEALVESKVVVKNGETYEFHPRVFNEPAGQWCLVALEAQELTAFSDHLGVAPSEIGNLSFQEIQLKSKQVFVDSHQANQLKVLLEKAGFGHVRGAHFYWSLEFKTELNREFYGQELYEQLLKITLNDLEQGLRLGDLAGGTVNLVDAFGRINPSRKRELSLADSTRLMIGKRVTEEAALIFLTKLVERGLASHFGLIESEQHLAAVQLSTLRLRRVEARAKRESELNRIVEESRAAAEEIRKQKMRVGLALEANPDSDISLEKVDRRDAPLGLDKIFSAIAWMSGSNVDELTVADFFEFFGGIQSQANSSRRVNFSNLNMMNGVGEKTFEKCIHFLLDAALIVPATGKADDEAIEREYDFHPRVYGEEIGKWIAVRANQDEFNFVASALGLSIEELLGLKFDQWDELSKQWRDLLQSNGVDAEAQKRLRYILNRTDLFDFRKNGFYGQPERDHAIT